MDHRSKDAGENIGVFEPPYDVRPIGTNLPEGNRRRIYLRTNYNSILLYFTLSIKYYSGGGWWLWDTGDGQQGAPE